MIPHSNPRIPGRQPLQVALLSQRGQRTCNASCLSVVSFNSAKRRVESFIVSYRGYRFITAYNKMLFYCLWRNVEASCRKHFVVVSRHKQTWPLTTSGKCHNLPQTGRAVLITPIWSRHLQHTIKPGPKSRFFAYPTCQTHLHSTPPLGGSPSEYCHYVWYWKVEWCGYPMVKNEDMLIRYDRIHKRHRQANRCTPHDGIGRDCIASRGKNGSVCVYVHCQSKA